MKYFITMISTQVLHVWVVALWKEKFVYITPTYVRHMLEDTKLTALDKAYSSRRFSPMFNEAQDLAMC